MRKILFTFLFVLMTLFACAPTKQIPNSYGSSIDTEIVGSQAIKTTILSLNRPDFNKTCKKEKISSNLDNWSQATFKAYEDGKKIIEYYYIAEDKNPSTIYRLDLDIVNKDTTFIVEIRRTINVK